MSIKNAVVSDDDREFRKHKKTIADRQRDFVTLGSALGYINAKKLYRIDGYDNFEDFVEVYCEMSRSYAYRQIDAARVVAILSPTGDKSRAGDQVKNEAQARALVPLGLDRDAMLAVLATTEKRGRITASALVEVRVELYPHTRVIDGEVVPDRAEIEGPKSPVVEAMTQAIKEAQTAADGPHPSAVGADSPDAGSAVPSGPSVLPPADGPDTPKIGIDEEVFTDRQREDAARQLDYLERGALNVVGPVKHFSEIECSVAEEADETPHWAAEIAKTTCVECLRTVVTSDSPVEGTSITTGIDSSRAAQPSTGAHQDSVPDSSEAGTAPDGQPQDPDGPESEGLVAASDRPGIEPPIAVGEVPVSASTPGAGAVPPVVAGVLPAGEAVEDGSAASSSTDPGAELVLEFAAFVDLLDTTHRFDAEVLGPMLTADQLKQIQGAVDEISRFAGSLETWRTP